jgi:hypothetical protein
MYLSTQHWDAFVQPLLLWRSSDYYIFCACVFSFSYPAFNKYMSRIFRWPFRLYNAFFSILSHKRDDFRKPVIEYKMCALLFSTNFDWNISHSKKNWATYDKSFILVFMKSKHCSSHMLVKYEHCRLIFEKYSNTKLHENPSSGNRRDISTDRQTDWLS